MFHQARIQKRRRKAKQKKAKRRKGNSNYLQLQPRKRRSISISNNSALRARIKKVVAAVDTAEVAEEVISLIIAERKEGEEINK